MQVLEQLCNYKQWADKTIFDSIRAIPEAERIRPRKIVFGSIQRTLHHVYAMDYVWKCHLKAEPHGFTTRRPSECPDFETLWNLQLEIDNWYVQYASTLDGSSCYEVVEFEFIGGGAGKMTRGEIMIHVVNHTTYHRGHIGDMLYESGIEPPTTDFPVFLRDSSK